MKKTYIKPENTVVKLNLETLIANSPTPPVATDPEQAADKNFDAGGGSNTLAREVINTPNAWDEW